MVGTKKTLTEELQVCNLLFNLKNCRKIDAWAVLKFFLNLVKGVSDLEMCVDYFALPGRGCESLNFCCRITEDGSTNAVLQILYGPYLILGVFGSYMF